MLLIHVSLFLVLCAIDASEQIRLLPDDPLGIVDEPLDMWCSTSTDSSLKSQNLEFSVELTNGKLIRVDPNFTVILNETTIKMMLLSVPLEYHRAHIICQEKHTNSSDQLHSSATKIYDVQTLSVGYRPFKPVIQKDYKVYYYEYFMFSWTINNTDPVYYTRYSAWYRTSSDTEFTQCLEGKKGSSKLHGNSCKIHKALDLVHPDGILFFKVNGSNLVGSVTSNVEKADLHHIIQPAKPKNVTVNSSVSEGVIATYYSPRHDKRLMYRISVGCGNITWDNILIKNLSFPVSKHPIRSKIELPFPPFMECRLSVSCLPYHNRQYWSEWSEAVSFISPDGVPLSGPEVCCFKIGSNNLKLNTHDVTIYFKHLTDSQARGKVVRFRTHYLTPGSQKHLLHSNNEYISSHKTSFTLEFYKDSNYTVSIAAETRAGYNQSATSVMIVPSEDIFLSFPQNVTVIWNGSNTIRVSWLQESLSPQMPFIYTIIWGRNPAIHPDGPVEWKRISSGYYDVILPRDENYLSYHFGLAVSTADGRSSGMRWIDCSYNISAGALLPVVRLFNKTSKAVILQLEKPVCSNRRSTGYIYEYQLRYGKDKEMRMFLNISALQLESSDWLVTIDDLMPKTEYSFLVVAMTSSGPSVEVVIVERTDSTGQLETYAWVLIAGGSVFGGILLLTGIYTCWRWNKELFAKIRRWFNMDIKVPDRQTLDDRGMADGGQISSSYTSLSGNKTNEVLVEMLLDVKSEEEFSKETSFSQDQNVKDSVTVEAAVGLEETRSLTEGISNNMQHVALSSSCPTSLRKHCTETSKRRSMNRIPQLNEPTNQPSVADISQGNNVLEARTQSGLGAEGETEICVSALNRTAARSEEDDANFNQVQRQACVVSQENNAVQLRDIGTRPHSAIQHERINEEATGSSTTDERNELGTNESSHQSSIEDYSNIRMSYLPEPSVEYESENVLDNGYSLASGLSAGIHETAEEDENNDYSTAVLADDGIAHLLNETEPQPIQQSEDYRSDDENEDYDNDHYDSYSRASMIRRPK